MTTRARMGGPGPGTAAIAKVYCSPPPREAHRRKRPRRPLPGMMLHQDGSRHEMRHEELDAMDLIVTMDDATSEIPSANGRREKSTASTFPGHNVAVLGTDGLQMNLYTEAAGAIIFFAPGRRPRRSHASDAGAGASVGASGSSSTSRRKFARRRLPRYQDRQAGAQPWTSPAATRDRSRRLLPQF